MGVLQETQSVFGPSQEEGLAEGMPLSLADTADGGEMSVPLRPLC